MSNTDHYADQEHEGRELQASIGEVVDVVSQAEVNQQIATAKRFPRSVSRFRKELRDLSTLDPVIAEQCTYVLPGRKGGDGKAITGPSVRFAEMVLTCWGNIRSAARTLPLGPDDEYIKAEGVCYDLERNNAIKFEVMRRITKSDGERFGADMVGVTGVAATSIALRNAVLKVVPKAFWTDIHENTKVVARGDKEGLAAKRGRIFEAFAGLSPPVSKQQIFDLMQVGGEADLTTDHLVELAGVITAIRDGDATVEGTFGATKQAGQQGHSNRSNEFSRGNGAQAPQGQQQGQPEPAKTQAQPQTQAQPSTAPAHAQTSVQALPAPDTQQQPATAKADETKTEPVKEGPNLTHEDRMQDAMRDYIKDKTAEIRASSRRVRDVTDHLMLVKEEFGQEHWVYGEMAKICEGIQNELLLTQQKGKGKGK